MTDTLHTLRRFAPLKGYCALLAAALFPVTIHFLGIALS